METGITVVLFLCVFLMDFLPMRREMRKKDIWIYFAVFTVGFVVLLLVSAGVEIPGPTGVIRAAVQKIVHIG